MSHIKVKIPRSRIATFDVFAMGKRKNHVAALIEFDHDLVDGMPMAAFVKDLNRSVEACDGLD
jgi:pyruvate/2-oxoglutarate dehydrogenase complex dihydrolipoamide acyltransferase (E2) component